MLIHGFGIYYILPIVPSLLNYGAERRAC